MKKQDKNEITKSTQYVGQKGASKKKQFSLNPKIIVGFQIVLIFGLITFMSVKFVRHYKNFAISSHSNQPQVAGLSDINIPEEVLVTVSNVTHKFKTQDFDFKVILVTEYDENSMQFKLNQLTEYINWDIPVPIKKNYHVIDYNQAKLEYWFINRFAELETEDKIEASMTFEQDQESIAECQIGSGSQKIPLGEFLKKFQNEIPEIVNLKVLATELTPKEKFINSICENIDIFEQTMSSVSFVPLDQKDKSKEKTIDFIDKQNSHKYFSYKVKNNLLEISIKNEDALKDEMKKLKAVIDQEPQNYEYRIKNGIFYLVGEFKPGQVLDIETTLENFKKDIQDNFKFEKVNLIFNETDQDLQKSNLEVQEYPKLVAQATLKSPLKPIDRINAIRNSLFVVDSTLIQPNDNFSLNKVLGEFTNNPNNLYGKIIIENEDKNIEYYDSIQAISTLVFRVLLEAGLENTQYLDIQKALYTDYYTYPYEEAMVATSIAKVLDEQSSSEIDLVFKNPTESPLLLILDEDIQNDQFIMKARIFSKSNYKDKRIELKNFQRSTFSQDEQDGFVESFVQFVDGNEQKFVLYYIK